MFSSFFEFSKLVLWNIHIHTYRQTDRQTHTHTHTHTELLRGSSSRGVTVFIVFLLKKFEKGIFLWKSNLFSTAIVHLITMSVTAAFDKNTTYNISYELLRPSKFLKSWNCPLFIERQWIEILMEMLRVLTMVVRWSGMSVPGKCSSWIA